MSLLPFNNFGGISILPTKNSSIPSSGGGFNFNSVVGTVSTVLPYLDALVSGDILRKTIGQIKDGFDCWGSTWTPSKAKDELPEYFAEFQKLLANVFTSNEISEQALNQVFVDIWNVKITSQPLYGWIGWRHDTAKDCTLRGLKDLETGIDAFLPEMANAAKQALVSLDYTVTQSTRTLTLYRFANNKGKSYRKTVPYFKIQKNVSGIFGGSSTSNSSSSSNTLLAIGAAVLAKKLWF